MGGRFYRQYAEYRYAQITGGGRATSRAVRLAPMAKPARWAILGAHRETQGFYDVFIQKVKRFRFPTSHVLRDGKRAIQNFFPAEIPTRKPPSKRR